MPVSPAHQALRQATAAAHAHLDALFARFDLADLASYAAFLQAHAAALLPAEAWLDAAGAKRVTGDWPQRRRAALLRADLAALGAAIPAGDPLAIDPSPPAVAGVLYVVEGSRLGGRVLARNVGAGLPHSYLAPGAPQPSWQRLLASLDGILTAPTAQDAAAEAARAVFTRFEVAGRAHLPAVPA